MIIYKIIMDGIYGLQIDPEFTIIQYYEINT